MPVPNSGAPASRLLIRDEVQDKIRNAILEGTLVPGERLHDEDLIGWLGVSRTPIREAISALANEGLIEMAPNRYTRVAQPNPAEVLDAYRTLGIILGGAVRLAIPYLTEVQRKSAIARLDESLRTLPIQGTPSIVPTIHIAYHAWLDRCPNRQLVTVGRQVMDGLAYKLRVETIGDLIPAKLLIEHLTDFRAAIIASDAVAAKLAIEAAHMLPRH
ncbi:GntR family transcriptional regulator [Curtobacterium flaccumfaciens]|uniref:GntR family transcriptional regulator n=1 Tax=Curtobacterium TaxID=2034 RepID=UPI000F477BB4|nr:MULTISPECIES: GntR family transcriptional regulator [Curtobacterium]ROR36419.1 DNA-binding GntR family transcriptional regulator [Curtobacterium sp. JUb34]UXN20908.1 GntR family transcriptional regulator [Curtobacterium flaccumfaciens pv. flaccumfaciens]